MNITREIAEELKEQHGSNVFDIIMATPEIQFYANSENARYQFRDGVFEEFADVWNNPQFESRKDFKKFIMLHLKETGRII